LLQLQCWRLQQQAATSASITEPCRLKVFYNTTNITVPDPSTFSIDAGTLPVEGFEVPPYTEDALNRTETFKLQNGTCVQHVNCPLLYFHGGPSCNLLLDKPVICGVKLPANYSRHATQVCAKARQAQACPATHMCTGTQNGK
jgi:hypothetical protein